MASQPCSGLGNTTECWLNELWKQQDKTEFSKRTFGFTVTFTVLVFVIAWITVFQGAVFAGSGRLKASRRAIGDFNKYTSKLYHFRYSFREARFRTTTMVPIFRFPAIEPHTAFHTREIIQWWKDAEKTCQKPPKSRTSGITDSIRSFISSKAPPSTNDTFPALPVANSETELESGLKTEIQVKPKSPSKSRPKHATIYAASWANLLESFDSSLSLFEFQSPNRGTDSLLFCDTEYVPGDVSAAPATGNIETIVTMAALAGCEMISFPNNNEYPVARGSNLQLTFREHLQLGAIATFRMFPGPKTFNQKWDIPSLFRECYLPTNPTVLLDINSDKILPQDNELYALLATNPGWPRASPFSQRVLHNIAQCLCLHSKAWTTLDVRVIIVSLLNHFDQWPFDLYWRVDDWEPLTVKDWPRNARFKFDYSDMSLSPEVRKSEDDECHVSEQSLGPDFATENDWMSTSYRVTKRPLMKTVRLNETEDILGNAEHSFNTRIAYWEELIAQGGNYGDFDTVQPPDNAMVIIPLAIFTCVHFVARRTVFDDIDLDDKAAIRGALRWQLNELDAYLYKMCTALDTPNIPSIGFSNEELLKYLRSEVIRSDICQPDRYTSATLMTDTPKTGTTKKDTTKTDTSTMDTTEMDTTKTDTTKTGASKNIILDSDTFETGKLPAEIKKGRSINQAREFLKDKYLAKKVDALCKAFPSQGNEAKYPHLYNEDVRAYNINKIRDVIVFRAIVMAAFLSTAADLSHVIGTEVGKRIVSFV